MSLQIAANVSGFDPSTDEVPKLFNDSPAVPAGVWSFDPGNTRGHWSFNDGIPSNGWTLIAGLTNQRVWLTLTDDHQPLAPGSYELALLKSDPGQPPMPGVLAYQPPQLPAITVDGLYLQANGVRWTYRGASHFLAFLQYLLGQPVIDYPGPNIYRVFGTMVNVPGQVGLPPLDPDAFGNYFPQLDAFCAALSARGKYLDFCAIADNQLLKKDPGWCQRFLLQCDEVFQGHTNVLPCAGNEPWANGFDRTWFSQPNSTVTWSNASIQDAGQGDAGKDSWDSPQANHWKVIRVHTRRDFPKMLTHCAQPDPLYTYGHPVIIDEPFKYADPTHGGYYDPNYCWIASHLGCGSVSGICYHTEGGTLSRPWDGNEAVGGAAFFT